jgi:hypothetical protein
MLLKSLALYYTKQENLTQNKTKQTMRQTADSPERGKATNRKRAGRKML